MTTPTRPAAPTARFAPSRISLLGAGLALLGAVPFVGTWPVTWPVLLLPVVAAVWVLRARAVLGPGGVAWCNGLRSHRVAWEAVQGFDVPRRGPVRLMHSGRTTPLLAVPHADARRLVLAARAAAPPPA